MVDKWPAFVWRLLNNEQIIGENGVTVWSYVPEAWRVWWIDAVRERGIFAEVTLTNPPSIFKDVTTNREEFLGSLKRLELTNLMECCDKHLHDTVRCPWGCTEYLHKAESLALDVVFARYLGVTLVTDCARGEEVVMRSARGDFDSSSDVSFILMNPKWRIMPSIAFFDNGEPRVLLCRNHKGGSKLDYLHMPRCPRGVLPDIMADQLAHAVVMPQTIRPMEARAYSNSYQMHKMRGSYCGIGTLDVTDLGRFDVTSKIRDYNQRLTILGRKDIRGLVTRQMRTGLIPNWLGDTLLADAECEEEVMALTFENERLGMMRNGDQKEWWEQYCVGATRITLSDAVKLQRLLDDNGRDTEVLIPSGTSGEWFAATIVGSWPLELIWTHVGNKHGARFPALKVFKNNGYDTRYLWFLLAMITSIPSFWCKVVASVRADNEWPGWMLSYATRHCLASRKQRASRNNPFSKHKTIAKMMAVTAGQFGNELFTAESFSRVVSVVCGVYRVHASLLLDGGFGVPDDVDTIVAFRYESNGQAELPDSISPSAGSEKFELRFVGTSDTPDFAKEY
jgi:hypothetical protein